MLASALAAAFFHRVRREAELANRRGIDFIEHRLDAPPGHDSAVSWYGFDAFDPSFAVQNALYHAQDSDEESLDEIADNVCAEVTSGLRSARLIMEDDSAFVTRLRMWQTRLLGIEAVRDAGPPAKILRDLPAACADLFLEVARRAFTDEATPPSPC